MKKLKPIIIIIIIILIAALGLYFGYRYSRSKKTADVVAISSSAMDGYWGDTIQSYGDVTSEKSQTAYIASGTEIVSVNVAAGDHVNEGDVLMVVKKETQDINGKTLQLEKAAHNLKVEQLKLQRLENTTPIPEYMHSQEVYHDTDYLAAKGYVASEDITIDGLDYHAGDIVVLYTYNVTGEVTGTTYLYPGFNDNGGNYKEIEDESKTSNIKSYVENNGDKFSIEEEHDTYSWLASILYLDGETQKIVGEDTFDIEGKQTHGGKPTGLTPSQLKTEIDTQTMSVKKLDLEYRKLENELEVMKNTTDSGQIIAKVSGTVSKVQNKDNYNNTQPFIVVSATDEYFISGSIGEFYLGKVNVGDTVSVTSWENGVSAEAVITEISDSPSNDQNFYNGSGNSNSSNYAFKASFDRNSGIEIGTAVDITITPGDQEASGLYIPSYFVRKDSSGNYVMKMGDNNSLKKEYVKVGKTLWGSMVEIKSGITIEDYLAFPYGNGAMEGITCKIVDYIE